MRYSPLTYVSLFLLFCACNLTLSACSLTIPFTKAGSKTTEEANSNPSTASTEQFSTWYYKSGPLCSTTIEEAQSYEVPSHIDLWERVREGFSMTEETHPRIHQNMNWYSRHPSYMKRVSARAERYLYYIVEELERRNLPMELALLPIVESAYDPFAYSHGRASGMWQIIPGTGKMLGLKQNWWYDGRRDITASTHAALDYLEALNKRFDGDWLLALAAYNSGAGNVNKAIRKNKRKDLPLDFWSLSLLSLIPI